MAFATKFAIISSLYCVHSIGEADMGAVLDDVEVQKHMRSFLLISADDPDGIKEAYDSGADALILNLESSLTPECKQAARIRVTAALNMHRNTQTYLIVRVSALTSIHIMADLAAILPSKPNAVMLPACEGGIDIQHLSALLAVSEAEAGIADGSTQIIATAFSRPTAIFARDPLNGASKRLIGLTWDAQHTAQTLGAQVYDHEAKPRYTAPLQLSRSLTVFAAHAAKVMAIDAPFTNLQNLAGFEAECLAAKRDGFAGKIALHPSQVTSIKRVFQ